MKNYRLLIYLLCVLIPGQLISCRKSDGLLTKVFNQTELKTIDKIISYYDDYVISHTGNQLPIDKAYIAFLEKKVPMVKETGDFNILLTDRNERIKFFESIDRYVLSEIYDIRDTVNFHFCGENEARKLYSPYSFNLNYDGKYASFL